MNNTDRSMQVVIYCAYPYSRDPEGMTNEINARCKMIYEKYIPNVDLVLLIPHNVFDRVFDNPIGASNSWMLAAELELIDRCDALAYSPHAISEGVRWEMAYCEKRGIPIVTYDQLLQGVRPPRRIGIKMRQMRTFASGATRDSDEGKIDYEGFFSPQVMKAFGEYMHKNQVQADGKLRASDNWQKGITMDAYMKSMFRHFMDVWFCHRGLNELSRDGLIDALGGLMFNVQGYWFEVLRGEAIAKRDALFRVQPDKLTNAEIDELNAVSTKPLCEADRAKLTAAQEDI